MENNTGKCYNVRILVQKGGREKMATPAEYMEFVCGQIGGVGEIRYKKMFGEYMLYVDDRPIFTVCDSTVYVKKLDELQEEMKDAETGCPYNGAKEHYILDIDNEELAKKVALKLKELIPAPKPKKKAKKENGL